MWGWRYNLHTPDHNFTRQIRVLIQLVWAPLWQDLHIWWTPSQKVHQKQLPATNLRHLHHCTRPSNTWITTDVRHERDQPLPSSTQTAEPKLPWDTRIWQSRAIQTRSASLKQAHPRSWQHRFASSSCPALQGNKCHLTISCTHPTVTVTGQALQPHWEETRE